MKENAMTNIILILILAAIIGFAAFYIIREKKRGRKCIGCPYACKGGTSCPCHSSEN